MATNLAVLFALAGSFVSAQNIPNLVRQALQRQPDLRVLDAPLDPSLLNEMKKYDAWPPWSELDLDGDGRKDAVAVVVKGDGDNRTYGVIAIHARTPRTLHWVAPLDKEPITGLNANYPQGAVVPLFCFECDANLFDRWSGTAYEPVLFRIGEQFALFDVDNRRTVNLYADGTRDSKVVASRELCAFAKVLERRGTSADNR